MFKYENEKWRITDTIIEKDTTFGNDAAIYDKTVVIGSKNYTTKNGKVSQKGKVYLYSIDTNDKLKLQKTIVPLAEDDADIGFGSKVELYDNTLLIGAETSFPLKKSGALYVYDMDRQTYETSLDTVLKADKPLDCDWYANAFDLYQGILVVGAMGNTINKNTEVEYMGVAYIYEKKNGKWQLLKKEYAINPTEWDKYGFSVSIFDSNIFIGCRFDNEDENEKHWTENAGAIYRYKVVK